MQVRDARDDMTILAHELATLSFSIKMLQADCTKLELPESVWGDLSNNLEEVLKACAKTAKEMTNILTLYMSAECLTGLRWALNGRDKVEKLKLSFKNYSHAISLALLVGEA